MPRRIVDHRRRGGRRTHPQNRTNSGAVDRGAGAPPPPVVPKEDFDFDRANSKFDKASIYASAAAATDPSNADGSAGTGAETSEKMASPEPGEIVASPRVKEEPKKFYDKSKSFFDDISSDAKSKADGGVGGGRSGGGGRGRGGGGRGGRNRRDEERTKNLTTFGETGTGSGSGYGQWQGGANGGINGNPGWRGGRRRRPNNASHQVRLNL
jgi:protein LSM14